MDAIQTMQTARALLDAQGGRAEAEAARRAREMAAAGRSGEAETWQKIRQAIRQLRGPIST
jgi:hypothetical protein